MIKWYAKYWVLGYSSQIWTWVTFYKRTRPVTMSRFASQVIDTLLTPTFWSHAMPRCTTLLLRYSQPVATFWNMRQETQAIKLTLCLKDNIRQLWLFSILWEIQQLMKYANTGSMWLPPIGSWMYKELTQPCLVTLKWVNIGSGNGLVLDGTKPLPELMLTNLSDFSWYSPQINFTENVYGIYPLYEFGND